MIKDYNLEKLNYSNYTPNDIVEVEKYIGDDDGYIVRLIRKAIQGETVLEIAPTGSGKTYSMINLLKSTDTIKAIFVVPNTMQVEQIANSKKYNIPGAYGEDISVLEVLEKGNIIAATWDKFIQIPKETLEDYIVVLDEVHQIYTEMYREEKINKLYEKLPYCQGQIHITATPNKLDFKQYDYIVEYKQKKKTKYDVKLYKGIDDKAIFNIIKNCEGQFALFRNNKNFLNLVIENNPTKKIGMIESDTKHTSSAYDDIVTNETMKNVDGIVNTSCLVAGVNINDSNVTDIIIIDVKDIATIIQYIARFRDLKKVNVHIFNNYKEESKFYEIEDLVNIQLERIKSDVEFYNNRYCNKTFTEIALDLKPFNTTLDNQQLYWSTLHNKYVESNPGIRGLIYSTYYKKADIGSFKVLLEEYLPNIEIVDIKNPNQDISKLYKQLVKESKKEALQILEENKHIVVGAIEILSDRIGKNLEGYLVGQDIEEIKQQLLNLNIDKLINISGIGKILNVYSKYVVKDGFDHELAWCLATKEKNSREKFFGQLSNIVYREVETKYDDLMRYVKIEDKMYFFIKQFFKPGISYTNEDLEKFVEATEITLGIKTTSNKIGRLLNQMFNIEMKNTRVGTVTEYNFLYNTLSDTVPKDKKLRIYTIKNFITIEDIVNQNNLSDLSYSILKDIVQTRIKNIDKEAVIITDMTKLAFGQAFSWCS